MIALDVVDDIIVVSRRNFLTPDQLVIARVPAKGQEQSIEFKEITQPTEIDGFSNFTFHYLDLTSPESSESFRKYSYNSSFYENFTLIIFCYPSHCVSLYVQLSK